MRHLAGKTVAVFDLDDTLSDTTQRRHFIDAPKGSRRDWDGFWDACDKDADRPAFVGMALELQRQGVGVVIFSGRVESTAEKTALWLAERGVEPQATRLRPARAYDKSHALKMRWLQELQDAGAHVLFAIDDERGNIQAFRDAGIHCLDAKDEALAKSEFAKVMESLSERGPKPKAF